jgi:vacuolar-type H+-ATPase subunit I/STV1
MMGVVKPTEEERQQMEEAAKNAKPDPNTQALEAMAQEAIAGAKKKEAEVFETLAQTEKIKAETLNTLDEIDLKKLQESRAYLEQVEKLQQQRQQMALQQQQQMVQQTPNVG